MSKRKPMPTEAVHPADPLIQPTPLWLEILGGMVILVPVFVVLVALLILA